MADEARPEEGLSQAQSNDTRPIYEVGFHLVPTISEEGLAAEVQKVRALLGDVEIIAEGAPAKMTLAYTIERATQGKREKFTQAYFGWIKFVGVRETIPALEAALRESPSVLRSLIIETVREDLSQAKQRAVFGSTRLEGQTLEKKTEEEKGGAVSEEALDKSIEALTG